MSPLSVAPLLAAATLHAGWNLLIKRAADRQPTLWWALLIGGLVLLPALLVAWPIRWEAITLALASSGFEVLYFVTLLPAYQVGDLSLVYPVARGSAPLLITLWAGLFLGERPSAGGWAGIGLVVTGLTLASTPKPSADVLSSNRRPMLALVLALATGLAISGYSTINKVGVAYASPAAYTSLFHLGTVLLLTPYELRLPAQKLMLPWRTEPGKTLLIGLMIGGASLLVMAALSTERAGYVGAIREVSVVLGALAGWLLLGEPLGHRRTLAACIMFAGLASIATLG